MPSQGISAGLRGTATPQGVASSCPCRDLKLRMQNLGHQLVSRQFDSSRISELHHKLQQIAPGLIKPAPGRARRCICEAARTCPINISPDHVAIDQGMQPGVKPRELAREFRNRLDDNPEPRQAAHGRAPARSSPCAGGWCLRQRPPPADPSSDETEPRRALAQ